MTKANMGQGRIAKALNADGVVSPRPQQARPAGCPRRRGDKYLLPGGMLVCPTCGGHFEGGTVCHWARKDKPNVLLAGDILQVVMDRRYVSFMYSYPNLWPLNARAVKHIARMLEPFDYDQIYSAFRNMRVLEDGKGAVARSVERYLKAIAD